MTSLATITVSHLWDELTRFPLAYTGLLTLLLVVPVGFEPTLTANRAAFLPLEDGTIVLLCSPSRTRTYDPTINSRLLYQLSYQGITLVELGGIEPPTLAFSGRRSTN